MRAFSIFDARKRPRRPCAVFTYDEKAGACGISIMPDAGAEDVPMLLAPFVEAGERELGDEWTRRWVQERVVPPSRQNLGEILRELGLEEYDEIEIMIQNGGRCAQDDFEIAELGSVSYATVPLGPSDAAGKADGGGSADALGPGRAGASAGRAFAAARREAGVTQAELARRTGLQQAAISRFERGLANPTVETLEALAAGIGAALEIRFV